ncbi:MAG: hypothetical protein HYU66_13630 [Armatimonadetes bacterium]|nr:hypothetical protein [Armatimonadota bacterium]
MDDDQLEADIRADLQDAPNGLVVYVEGPSDIPTVFALLGVAEPRDGIHGGTLVKVPPRAGGKLSLDGALRVAAERGLPGVFALRDGDGCAFAELASRFDAPFAGPLYWWKSYSAECLLAAAGWPGNWPALPDWPSALEPYGPCVAINRLSRHLSATLEQLGLHRLLRNPPSPLPTAAGIRSQLSAGKHALLTFDAEAAFDAECLEFGQLLCADLREALCRFNGKWLTNHLGPARTGLPPEACRDQWLNDVRSRGGLPEVRDLWRRITGRDP